MTLPKGVADKARYHNDLLKTPFVMFQSDKDDFKKMSIESESLDHSNYLLSEKLGGQDQSNFRSSQDVLSGIQEKSILSEVFFHPKNIDIIQKQIIMEICRRSNVIFVIL